jgi:hypothetical protein
MRRQRAPPADVGLFFNLLATAPAATLGRTSPTAQGAGGSFSIALEASDGTGSEDTAAHGLGWISNFGRRQHRRSPHADRQSMGLSTSLRGDGTLPSPPRPRRSLSPSGKGPIWLGRHSVDSSMPRAREEGARVLRRQIDQVKRKIAEKVATVSQSTIEVDRYDPSSPSKQMSGDGNGLRDDDLGSPPPPKSPAKFETPTQYAIS